jgi:hypothetical protein
MPKRVRYEGLRRENITVCIPKALKDAIEQSDNKSQLVTQILEENRNRILNGDVDKATEYANKLIRKKVTDEFRTQLRATTYNIKPSPDLLKLRSELQQVQGVVKRLTRDSNILISNSAEINRELKNTIQGQLDKVIKESYDELTRDGNTE